MAQQANARRHGAAGRQQIIQDHDSLAGADGIGLHFNPVRAVFQRVIKANALTRQLALLAEHDEAKPQFQRERGSHQKAAAFNAGQKVRLIGADRLRHARHGSAPGRAVPEQGGNVIEKNARLRKIRDAADMRLEINLVVWVCHVSSLSLLLLH